VRVRVTFKVRNRGAVVPFHHQHLIAQVLRGLIINSAEEQFKSFPYYNFSGLKGQTRVSRSGLHYTSSRVTIVLSSTNRDFLDFLIARIFDQEKIDFGGLIISPEFVDEEMSVSFEKSTKLLAISPIILLQASFNSDESKRFIEPGTDDFSDLLFTSTMQRMEEHGIDTESIVGVNKFQIVPDLVYINKIRQSQKKFSRIYSFYDQDVRYEVRGYTFPFTIYASEEVQDFIFTCGLGYYGNKGFGMVDVANADPTKRTTGYRTRELISA